MRKLFFGCIILFAIIPSYAQVKIPAASPAQTIKQDFGLGFIEVKYSRPAAKGRKVFGGLEPFGTIWRTGANNATTIRFTDKVELDGKKIDSGTYALYTIPGIEDWEVIINKGVNNWGVEGYKESEDVVRFKVAPIKLKRSVETFTIQFDNVLPERCDVTVMWDKTAIQIPVTTSVKSKIKMQLDAAFQTDKKPYWQAAQYYNEYDKNLQKALENINAAVKESPKAYYMWLYKAKIEQEMGNTADAKESSNTSLKLSIEAKNESYVQLNKTFLKQLK